jgi:hypothetical protein
MMTRISARFVYFALAAGTIALGLWVHRGGAVPDVDARDVLADAIWAGMIVWWVGAIAPGVTLMMRSALALGICFAVELSQLIHVPALDAVRQTTVGHLILGSGFDARDLASYAMGVAAATLLDWIVFVGRTRASR